MNRIVLLLLVSALFSALLLAAGCNCESEAVEELDAAMDAGEDAGSDAGWEPVEPPGEDAAAEMRETGDCEGRCCALPEEVALLALDREGVAPVASLAVDRSVNRFASVERGLGNCLDKLLVFELESWSYQPETLTAMDDCYSITTPIIGPGDGGWLVLWVDHRDSTEVRSAVYAPGQELVPAEPFQVSESGRMERELAMTRMGDSVLVAWAEEDVFAGTWAVVARQVSPGGEPLGPAYIVRESNERSFDSLDLTYLGENGAVLLYKAGGSEPELVMQMLDATGQGKGTLEVLSGGAGPYGSAAATWEGGEGAVVYSVAPASTGGQVHFRSVESTGELRQDDRAIVAPPERGSDASIVRLVTGRTVSYMVAYRGVKESAEGEKGMIRVISLDKDGNVQGSSDVYEASLSGNRTSLRLTSNLRVAVSWTDVYDDGTREHKLVNLWCRE